MICIGIDCGTQSLKTLAWDSESGKTLSASRSYELIEGLAPGHKEQFPGDWIDALESCISELKKKGLDCRDVRAIGVSGQQHGLVVLDSHHEVVRPAKLWCDTSTAAECAAILQAAGGPRRYQDEIGNLLPPGFTASKLLWLKNREFDSYRRIRHCLLPHDYLNFHLSGEMTTEAGDASGTGYFQVRQRRWSTSALGWIDSERELSECLPTLIDSNRASGQLRRSLSRRWGMDGRVLVSSGGGDNMMGAIGSGNVRPGLVTVSLGTSGTLFSCCREPVVDPRGEIAAFCDSTGGWLPLGCTMNVTVATGMVHHGFFGDSGLREFDEAVAGVPPGCDGLLLVPYLEGERLPDVPDGTGVLLGLREKTARPEHLARAAMEGVTLGLRYALDRMRELGIDPEEIRLIGGGARSPVWRQIAASIFQVPVVCPGGEEGPAFGAALQAYWCTTGGEIGDVTDRFIELDESTRCLPRLSERRFYERLYALYRRFSCELIESGVFAAHRELLG